MIHRNRQQKSIWHWHLICVALLAAGTIVFDRKMFWIFESRERFMNAERILCLGASKKTAWTISQSDSLLYFEKLPFNTSSLTLFQLSIVSVWDFVLVFKNQISSGKSGDNPKVEINNKTILGIPSVLIFCNMIGLVNVCKMSIYLMVEIREVLFRERYRVSRFNNEATVNNQYRCRYDM